MSKRERARALHRWEPAHSEKLRKFDLGCLVAAVRRCTPTLFPAILGLYLDKRATLVKDVSVLSSSWGAMKHEASRACSHYRLSNVISGWRCRATI